MADDQSTADTEKKDAPVTSSSDASAAGKKKQRGILSRIWNGIFSLHRKDDFEKRLEHISKEEASVLARMKRRSYTWRRLIRNLIIISVIFEVIAVIYAIMTTRSVELDWQMRAFRVLPMFVLPCFSFLTYSSIISFTRMCDRKDQKSLERLRAERKTKIDELKERTNYYITQQLIQRYDPDPAAKAAAATVLASKLGADSGLKLYVGDESSEANVSTGKSNDVQLTPSTGLRNRKQPLSRSSGAGIPSLQQVDENSPLSAGTEVPLISEHNRLVVDHYSPQGPASNDGGWIARIAALLVGEDPTQSYALICGNCHMHNGLARKEDFPYITYYCPHCNALNRQKQSVDPSGSSTPNSRGIDVDQISTASISAGDSVITSDSPVKAGSEVQEVTERVASASS